MPPLEFQILAKSYTLTAFYGNSEQVTPTAAESQWRLLALPNVFCLESRKEREKQHHTHIIMLSRKDRDQPHFKSKLHSVILPQAFVKTNQPKITKKTHAEISPTAHYFPVITVDALSMRQMLNWTTEHSKIKQAARRGERSKKASEEKLDKSFWTRFYRSKEISAWFSHTWDW